ncbi:MAG: YbaY family lipoprotein [Sphaerochaetaceae bacterium]|nr:YbaY family lipoprotein [Sphaerochaetaceae bacterium]
MKRIRWFLLTVLTLSLLVACRSTKPQAATQFSLRQTQQTEHVNGHLMGTVNYGAGFFFPSTSDILDISLMKTDAITGLMTEISHLRYRNIQKFPLPFSLIYDMADVSEGDSCSLIITLSVDGSVKAQGLTQLTFTANGFEDVSITLVSL